MLLFKKHAATAALALLGSVSIGLSATLHPIWWLAWVASTPILIAAFRSRISTGFWIAFVSATVGGIPMFQYLLNVASFTIAVATILLLAFLYAVGIIFTVASKRQLASRVSFLAFPAWTAAVDAIISHLSPHGSALSFAYSQMDFPPVLQAASLGGTPAIIFIVNLFSVGLAFLLAPETWSRKRAGALMMLMAIAATSGGALRIALSPPEKLEKVALAAIDADTQLPSNWRAVLPAYHAQLLNASTRNVKMMVLPEEIAWVSDADLPIAEAEFADWSQSTGIVLAVGIRVGADKRAHNRLLIFGPDGLKQQYDKVHLIPGFESEEIVAGLNPVLEGLIGGLPVGGAICKDFDFSETGRSLAERGARVVVAPSWDFRVDGWLHSRMAVLRGVEGGFTLIRSARRGEMTVSDRFGRIIVSAPSGPDARLLVADAPIPAGQVPLYVVVGDLFGNTCVFGVLCLLCWILIGGRRRILPWFLFRSCETLDPS